MARIRTTKPEFFTSEQVMNLSICARFAFLGMWNFCDDGGNHPASPKTLKAEVFPSDDVTSTDVQGYVDEMIGQGLLALYEAGGKQFWHVTGWHHQRIDKPTIKHPPFPEISTPQPRPIEEPSKTTPRALVEKSESDPGGLTPGVEGIGVEGIGMESKVLEGTGDDVFRLRADAPPPVPAKAPAPAKRKPAEQESPKTAATWEAYDAAYFERYGVMHVRNPKVNGQMLNLMKLLPADAAPAVAAFYVRHNNAFYVAKGHSVGMLLADAEKLHMEWASGKQITSAQARQMDRTQTNFNAFAPMLAEARAREAAQRQAGFTERDYDEDLDAAAAK